MTTLRLSNGVEIPIVGLGVFRAGPAETRSAVRAAIEAGYRHVDTARVMPHVDQIEVHPFHQQRETRAALDALDEGLATGWDPRGQP